MLFSKIDDFISKNPKKTVWLCAIALLSIGVYLFEYHLGAAIVTLSLGIIISIFFDKEHEE